uniref:Uncharacterized protein n=1 Tax=Glossina brevipalpis TaxID=37001 RepID=A0A1A9X0F4_9MUSC
MSSGITFGTTFIECVLKCDVPLAPINSYKDRIATHGNKGQSTFAVVDNLHTADTVVAFENTLHSKCYYGNTSFVTHPPHYCLKYLRNFNKARRNERCSRKKLNTEPTKLLPEKYRMDGNKIE